MSINKREKDMCLLVGASDFYLKEDFALERAYIIACDGGYEHLVSRAILPDAVIGDFDSLGHIPDFEAVEILPRAKDDTDIFYAAKKAFDMGYRKFYLCGCAEGERAEHAWANISVMLYLSRRGCECIMEGKSRYYRVISGKSKLVFSHNKGYFSAFALSEEVAGVSLRGFEYELEGATITSDVPLGVSNSFMSDICEVEIEKGDLLLIWEK